MEYDISRWLKDDLGLLHMSEASLSSLMYHPRHGSLCRRLIKFLAESTLCGQRYQNVYVNEDLATTMEEYEAKHRLLSDTMEDLETQMRDNESEQRELCFLVDKLECLTAIGDLQKTSTEALQEMASRPNFALEQMSQQIGMADYLGNMDLEKAYSIDELSKSMDGSEISARQLAAVQEEFDDLMEKTRVMQAATSQHLQTVARELSKLNCDTKSKELLKKRNVDQLLALKVPECVQIEMDADPQIGQLKQEGDQLERSVCVIDQQVVELAERYKRGRNEVSKKYKDKLEIDLAFLKDLQELEMEMTRGNVCSAKESAD